MEVKYVLDLRDFPGDPIEKKIVHDYKDITADEEVKAEEAPKKRGRKPKAEAEPTAAKAPAKRTRKPKEPKE